MSTAAPTGFVGLSHLGLVASIGWASRGDPVIAVDSDREIVDLLTRSELPILEPGLEDALSAARPRMAFTTDVASLGECPLVILSRDVPTTEDNISDVSLVEQLLEAATPHLRPQATVVVMSQVPPGFTRSVASRLRRSRPGAGFRVYYWVETLILGHAMNRFLRPERIILGCEDPRAALPDVLEQGLKRFDCPLLPMRYESAELTKTAINLYLCSAVTYANTLSDICERIDADWSEVVPALRLDARIGPAAYIRPSLGISGGNLERDLMTLQRLGRQRGVDVSFIDTIIAYNARRSQWIMNKLDTLVFAQVPTPTIAVWGLTYKRGTRSLKNSHALRAISSLGPRARWRAFDPAVQPPIEDTNVTLVRSRDEALVDADCLLIMTDWEEFASIDTAAFRRAMRRPLVIDCVGILEGRRGDLEGIRYVSMGLGDGL